MLIVLGGECSGDVAATYNQTNCKLKISLNFFRNCIAVHLEAYACVYIQGWDLIVKMVEKWFR